MKMQVILYKVNKEDVQHIVDLYASEHVSYEFVELTQPQGIRLHVAKAAKKPETLMFLFNKDSEALLQGLKIENVFYLDTPINEEQVDGYLTEVLKTESRLGHTEIVNPKETEEVIDQEADETSAEAVEVERPSIPVVEVPVIEEPVIEEHEQEIETAQALEIDEDTYGDPFGMDDDDPFGEADIEDTDAFAGLQTRPAHEVTEVVIPTEEYEDVIEDNVETTGTPLTNTSAASFGIVAALETQIITLQKEVATMVSPVVHGRLERQYKELENVYDTTVDDLVAAKAEIEELNNQPPLETQRAFKLTESSRVEFHFAVTPRAVDAMYGYLSKSMSEGAMVIDLSTSSYIDKHIAFEFVKQPKKWLYQGQSIEESLSKGTYRGEPVELVTAAAQPLDFDYLYEIDWDKVLDDLKPDARRGRVMVVINPLESPDQLTFLETLESLDITKVGYYVKDDPYDNRVLKVKQRSLAGRVTVDYIGVGR